ncbi:unnamed protein product [Tilletia controversa]|uniref:Uncharacterized protein n=1 Tax=Tilletia controversa TaxID=13291 RepID=A0A8X7MUG9_9BASI|nr:hypothetical protein CF328_g399 [Tilletia controversa]KAE8248744.1 hypothetical protein A4X06_0g3545 [Tilletia controversa]CAD6919108.1 unnamed protein product [Tilletia controversa]
MATASNSLRAGQLSRSSASTSPSSANPSPHRRRPRRRLMTEEISELSLSDHQQWPCSLNSPFLDLYGDEREDDDSVVLLAAVAAARAAAAATASVDGELPEGSAPSWPLITSGRRRDSISSSSSESLSDGEDTSSSSGGNRRRPGGRRGTAAASRWSSEWIEFRTMRPASDLARSASSFTLPTTAAAAATAGAEAPTFSATSSTFAARLLQLSRAAATSTSQLPLRDCPPPSLMAPARRHHHSHPYNHTSGLSEAAIDNLLVSTSNLSSASTLQPRTQRPGAAQRARNRSARVILLDSTTSPVLGGASAAVSSSQNSASSPFSPLSATADPAGTGANDATSSSNSRPPAVRTTSNDSAATNSALGPSIPLVRRRDHNAPFPRSEPRTAAARTDTIPRSLLIASNAALRDTPVLQSDAAASPTSAAEESGETEEGTSLMRRVMRRRRFDRERERERDRARERERERERQRDETRPLLEAEDRDGERRTSWSRPRWSLLSEQNSRVEALIMDWQLIEPTSASAENGPPVIRRSPSPIDPEADSSAQSGDDSVQPAADEIVTPVISAGLEPSSSSRTEGAQTAFQIPPWRIPSESTQPPVESRDLPSTSSGRPSNFAQSRPPSLLPARSSTFNVNVNLHRSSTTSSSSTSSSAVPTPVRDEFRARRSPRRLDSVTDADVQAFESHLAVLRASSLAGLSPPNVPVGGAGRMTPETGAGHGGVAHARSEGNSPESQSPASTIRLPVRSGSVVSGMSPSASVASRVEWRPASQSGEEVGPVDQSPQGTPETYFPTSRWFPPSMRRIGGGAADEPVAPDAVTSPGPTLLSPGIPTVDEVEQGRALARLQASQAETWTGSAAERDFQRLLNERDTSGSGGEGQAVDVAPAPAQDADPTGHEAVAHSDGSVTLAGLQSVFGTQTERLMNSEARLARLLAILRAPQVSERGDHGSAEREGSRAALESGRNRVDSDAAATRNALGDGEQTETLPTFRFTASRRERPVLQEGLMTMAELSTSDEAETKVDLLMEGDKVQLGTSGVELMQAIDSGAASLYRASIRSAFAARARYQSPAQPRLPSTSAEYPVRFEVWQANGQDVDNRAFKLNAPGGMLQDDWRTWRSGQTRSTSIVLRCLYLDPNLASGAATASTSSSLAGNLDIPSGSVNPDNVMEAYIRRQGERRAALAALTASATPLRRIQAAASTSTDGDDTSATSSSRSLRVTDRESLAAHAQHVQRFLELLHEELAVLEETFRRNSRPGGPSVRGIARNAATANASGPARSGASSSASSAVTSPLTSAIPGPVSISTYSARRAAATASTIARVQGLGSGAAGSLLPSQVRSLERLASTTGHGAERLAAVSSLDQTEIRALRDIIASQVLGTPRRTPRTDADGATEPFDGDSHELDPSLLEIGTSGTVVLPRLSLSEEEHELVQTCLDRALARSGTEDESGQEGSGLGFAPMGSPLKTLMQKRCDAFVRSALAAAGTERAALSRGRTFHLSSLEIRIARRRNGSQIEGLAFVSEEPMPCDIVQAFEKCDRSLLVEMLATSLGRHRPGSSLLAEEAARLESSGRGAGGEPDMMASLRRWTPAGYFKTGTGYVHLDFSTGTLSTSSSTSTSTTVQIRPDGRTSELGEYCVSGRFVTLVLFPVAASLGRARGGGRTAVTWTRTGTEGEEISVSFVAAKGFGMRSTPSGRIL